MSYITVSSGIPALPYHCELADMPCTHKITATCAASCTRRPTCAVSRPSTFEGCPALKAIRRITLAAAVRADKAAFKARMDAEDAAFKAMNDARYAARIAAI